MRRSFTIILGGLLASLTGMALASTRDTVAEHRLSLDVSGNHLLVQWRPIAGPAPDISRVEISHNGRTLSRLEGAALQGVSPRQTAALYVVDVGEGTSKDALRRTLAWHADNVVSRSASRTGIGLMLFDDQAVLAQPAPAPLVDVWMDMRSATPTGRAPNLWGALVQGIGYLGSLPVERRTLFLVSDGRSATEAGERDAELAQAALAAGVQIEPIVCPSDTTTRQGLERVRKLALASGGDVLLLQAEDCLPSLEEAFSRIDALSRGGSVAVPIGDLRKMPWERDSILAAHMTFSNGTESRLALPHAAPAAGLREVPAVYGVALATGLLVLIGAAAGFLVIRQGARPKA